MRCLRCTVREAVTKVTMGEVVYPTCDECRAKILHPAFQLAEMFRNQNAVNRLWEKA